MHSEQFATRFEAVAREKHLKTGRRRDELDQILSAKETQLGPEKAIGVSIRRPRTREVERLLASNARSVSRSDATKTLTTYHSSRLA